MQYVKHYWVNDSNQWLFKFNSFPKKHPLHIFSNLDIKYYLSDSSGVDFCISAIDDEIEIEEIQDEETNKKIVCLISQEQFNRIKDLFQDYRTTSIIHIDSTDIEVETFNGIENIKSIEDLDPSNISIASTTKTQYTYHLDDSDQKNKYVELISYIESL